jgi:asparagine synthetase B (glutamine-hydrolysing)
VLASEIKAVGRMCLNGIEAVSPGNYLTLGADWVRTEAYYRLPVAAVKKRPPGAWASELRSLLTSAAQLRTCSDVPGAISGE